MSRSTALIFLGSILLNGCVKDICTHEFAMITAQTEGGYLDKTATYRTSTQDTVSSYYNSQDSTSIPPPFYIVLDDNYAGELKNQSDIFTFYGWVKDSIVVEENYSISGDNCHIIKLSGPVVIQL